MRNLERGRGQASATQVHHYNLAKNMEELESRRKQVDDLWNRLEAADQELAQQQQDAEKASAIARKRKRENENLLQRLMNAIKSRNSMRGRLGNMTMQRNRAIRQVEALTVQNRQVMGELKVTTDKLGEAYQQINAVQQEYNQDMTELAQAYQRVDFELRSRLPESLKVLLDQLEQDYTGEQGYETTF